MIQVEASEVIQRPVAEVFAYLADFENNPRWEANFLDVKRLSPGPTAEGSAFECILKFPGQRVTSRFEITEFVPDQRIAFRGDKPGSATPVGSIETEPVDANSTRVTLRPRPEMKGLFHLMEPFMSGYIKKSNQRHLATLKQVLEAKN
jgi:uncharacterized protein YndB with AHSA1/START domain